MSAFDQSQGDSFLSFNLAEGLLTTIPDLDLKIKEADYRLILAFHAAQTCVKRKIVPSHRFCVFLVLF